MRPSTIRTAITGLALATGITLTSGSASAQTCKSTETRFGEIMGYIYTDDVMIIGHRGYWGRFNRRDTTIPENSIRAIQSANDRCIDGIELDIKLNEDNVAYLLHDFNLGRTTDYSTVMFGDRYFAPSVDRINPRFNPSVASVSSRDIARLQLLDPTRSRVSGQRVPRLDDTMELWQRNRMTVPILFDVKSSRAVRETHRVVTSRIPNALNKMGIKVNATLYQTPAAFYFDSPHMYPIPVFTTNMLVFRNIEQIFNNWFDVGAIEINYKQDFGIYNDQVNRTLRARKKMGVFQAIPDTPWPGNFYKNTGECCYTLANLYYQPPTGKRDTDDRRGDLNFLSSVGFSLITTDDPATAAPFYAARNRRRSHPSYF